MIANFKQWDSYWNNFNNGDEALFQDASLPRDTFWFKIRNWVQTAQQDWRTANANINLQQWIYKSALLVAWTADWSTLYPSLSEFKKEYTKSDFSFVDSFVTATWVSLSAEQRAKDRKSEISWSPKTYIKDWIVFIWEAGTYIIQAYSDFFYPSWYNPKTSYQFKEYVYLYSYDKKTWWTVWVRNQARACWTVDWLNTLFVGYLPKDLWLTVWVAHTYWTWNWDNFTPWSVICSTALNVYRLS